jgi:hypothetical protein
MRSLMTYTPHQILSRAVRWAGCVAYMAEKRNTSGFLWENLKERDSLEELVIDEPIILKLDPKDIIWERMKRIHLA